MALHAWLWCLTPPVKGIEADNLTLRQEGDTDVP